MRHDGVIAVLTQRRFWPLFIAQFTGAMNDNLFKNALIILIIFRIGGDKPQVLASLAGGLFILPFFLLSALAGRMADRFERTRMVRRIKLAEIPLTILAVGGLINQNPALLLAALFLLGCQAACFGPVKYAILPDLLSGKHLLTGNALIEGSTFIAILLGTLAGGFLVLRPGGLWLVGAAMALLALAGYTASLCLPHAGPGDSSRPLSWNIAALSWRVLGELKGRPRIQGAVLGVSWFWFVGATVLTQLPAFVKQSLGADEQAVSLMLTLFAIGVAIGALLCVAVLKTWRGKPFTPPLLAALGMALVLTDFALASLGQPAPSALLPLSDFLALPLSWRILADVLAASICGGFYVVPLYTLLQSGSEPHKRAETVAANNIANSLFMVISALGAALLLKQGLPLPNLFLITAILTLILLPGMRRLLR